MLEKKNSPNQPNEGPPPRSPPTPPYKPNSPTNPNELQFTVFYYTKLGQNHMWIDYNLDSDKIILIDKENPIFPNDKLIIKNHNYTINFFAYDAEKFNNQDHVYYFNKNNDKFTLKSCEPDRPEPVPSNRKEGKFDYVTLLEEKGFGYCHVFRDITTLYKINALFFKNLNLWKKQKLKKLRK